ncbi:biotin transporter BioY [Dermacoccaceae bacterium W4C1]
MPTFTARDITQIAMFAALFAVLGLPSGIAIAGPVPITLQSLGWMLAGCLLGAWRGAAAMVVFNLLVLGGLPIAAGGRGGIGVFAGPSGGYLVGAVAGIFVTGWIAQRVGRRSVPGLILACVLGCIGLTYAVGVPWTGWRLGSMDLALVTNAVQYLPGDLIKAVVAAVVTGTVVRAYPPAENLAGPARPRDRTAA